MSKHRLADSYREAFYETVLSEPCWFKGIIPHLCDGPMDPCHLISKQRLKRIAKDKKMDEQATLEMVWDHRNGVPGCRAFHHKFDNGFIRVYLEQLPTPFFHFVEDYEINEFDIPFKSEAF